MRLLYILTKLTLNCHLCGSIVWLRKLNLLVYSALRWALVKNFLWWTRWKLIFINRLINDADTNGNTLHMLVLVFYLPADRLLFLLLMMAWILINLINHRHQVLIALIPWHHRVGTAMAMHVMMRFLLVCCHVCSRAQLFIDEERVGLLFNRLINGRNGVTEFFDCLQKLFLSHSYRLSLQLFHDCFID